MTELFRLNQAQNNAKMDLAGQQSLHLWTNTNYFDQHLLKMWIDCCNFWERLSVAQLTPSDQLLRQFCYGLQYAAEKVALPGKSDLNRVAQL